MSFRKLPVELEGLNEIAHNLWWSWNDDAVQLFKKVNLKIWDETRNPIEILHATSDDEFAKLCKDQEFVGSVNAVLNKLNAYLNDNNTWFDQTIKGSKNDKIAYFSAEYGIHESLPIYSGGLGVLSGDHVKSTSDLGIPGVFVGLLYKDGYFVQQLDAEGQQVNVYEEHNPNLLAITPVMNGDKQLEISVDLAGREVFAAVWKAQVGRVPLFLLDSNVEKNNATDRELTARLYGGDRDMRISQEILLGIGGVRALTAMNIKPVAFHMNEGHSGFFQLERVREVMAERKLSFEEAKLIVSANCLFTTHTPVPAGNEAFTLALMHKYFFHYIRDFDISWDRFLKLGLVNDGSDNKFFSLTVFAINFSRFQNGVSELHGRISKKMWRDLWNGVPEIDNTISYITNGIHVETWMCPEVKNYLTSKYGASWINEIIHGDFWNRVYDLPVDEIKEIKKARKAKMIELVRSRLKEQLKRNGATQGAIQEVDTFLKDDVLTIGFARRFATYKRATLIFNDVKKLAKICNDANRPVQFIFAGKAHPADKPGQKFIKEIYEFSRSKDFKGKIVILENYDMNISSHLVSGVDVWLNNPRRPMEASGTSGQKVPINFGMNFSVLDGWWREGFDGENGWSIGVEKDYPNDQIQDFEDANDFYNTLQDTIVPLYYGSQDKWFELAKKSFVTNITRYSTGRMVGEYMTKFYAPAIKYGEYISSKDSAICKAYIVDRRFLRRNWETVCFNTPAFTDGVVIDAISRYNEFKDTPSHHVEIAIEDTLPGHVFETTSCKVEVPVYVGAIDPRNIKCEFVITDPADLNVYDSLALETDGQVVDGTVVFKGKFKSSDKNPRHLRFRVYPTFEGLHDKFELKYALWY